MTKDTRELVERLNSTLGGITVPDLMHGDNLAITLCTAYDNPDQDTDEETGWTPDAISGQEAVLAAIRAHYAPLNDTITTLSERVRVLEDEKATLREAILREAAAICGTHHPAVASFEDAVKFCTNDRNWRARGETFTF